MIYLDFFATKSRFGSVEATGSKLAIFLEGLFLAWISAFAAFFFLAALILAAFQIISLVQLFAVYAMITGLTILLAGALYLSRQAG